MPIGAFAFLPAGSSTSTDSVSNCFSLTVSDPVCHTVHSEPFNNHLPALTAVDALVVSNSKARCPRSRPTTPGSFSHRGRTNLRPVARGTRTAMKIISSYAVFS